MGSFLSVVPAGVGDGAVSQSFTGCRVRSAEAPSRSGGGTGTRCCRDYDGGSSLAMGRTPHAVPLSHSPRPSPRHTDEGSVRRATPGPPGQQLLACGVLADGPVVEPDGQEEVVGLPQHRPGSDGEGLGDLVAVELGPHAGELLLRGEALDAPLEVVVGP